MQASWLLEYTLILIYLICFLMMRFRLQSWDMNAMTWIGVWVIYMNRWCVLYDMNAITWIGVCVCVCVCVLYMKAMTWIGGVLYDMNSMTWVGGVCYTQG